MHFQVMMKVKIRPAINQKYSAPCVPSFASCGGFKLLSLLIMMPLIDEDFNCQECGKDYDDDSQADRKTWIGRDNCWR